MNRRDLLKLLPTVSAAAVIPTVEEAKTKNENWDRHKCFFCYWCGWQQPSNQAMLTGKWIASQPDHPFGWKVYSAYPGATSHYVGDQFFDLSVRNIQKIPVPNSSQEELLLFKQDAFKRLIRYIDLNYDLLIGEYEPSEWGHWKTVE
jgi:hypothetical protein